MNGTWSCIYPSYTSRQVSVGVETVGNCGDLGSSVLQIALRTNVGDRMFFKWPFCTGSVHSFFVFWKWDQQKKHGRQFSAIWRRVQEIRRGDLCSSPVSETVRLLFNNIENWNIIAVSLLIAGWNMAGVMRQDTKKCVYLLERDGRYMYWAFYEEHSIPQIDA